MKLHSLFESKPYSIWNFMDWTQKGEMTYRGDIFVSDTNSLVIDDMPDTVQGTFTISRCDLKTLEGLPYKVTDNIKIDETHITNLEGGPERAGADYFCLDNEFLVSLQGAPEFVEGSFYCSRNRKLTSLEGGPKRVGKNYHVEDCGLTSIKGIASTIGYTVVLQGNKIASLEGIEDHLHELTGSAGGINLRNNPLKSHILGLIFVKGLEWVSFDENTETERAIELITPFFNEPEAVYDAQRALLDGGYDEYAQL